MQSMQIQLKQKLSKLYDEIKGELEFDLSLRDLIEKREVWKTDILNFLRRTCRHLLTADVCELSENDRTDQMLQAELMIRHLIESLMAELTEFHSEDEPFCPSWRVNTVVDDTSVEWDRFFSESQKPPFIRVGDQIQVLVDHLSETNFFADISDNVQNGGLFVATYDVLSVGANLNVNLVLPGSGLFQLEGTVSWVREADNCADEDISPGMGICFKRLNPAPMKAIEEFMSEREPLLFEMT